MTPLGRLTYLRPCVASDDAFLYDVFATTWASEVAALPNQNLARHVLRIQHIAQERRIAGRYPGHQRFIVLQDGEPAGRLYVHGDAESMHVIDLTLMPRFRDRGIGSRILRDLFEVAAVDRHAVTARVDRRNRAATELYSRLGFKLVAVDDVDHHFEWSPSSAPSAMKEDARAMKEDARAVKVSEQPAVHHGADAR
jgi:GNAT superfamily N-acetyltransferase